MPFYTPLRYPGGKRRLSSVVMRLLEANGLKDVNYVEPYAGGAALALSLLLEEYASTIHINDLSRPVYAFWHSVLSDTEALCERIRCVEVTMEEWYRQRSIYDNRESVNLSDLGFATIFLNRTNRSGIIAGGVIGGKHQTGAWLIDARFTKEEIIQRIRRIGRYRDRIKLYQADALKFTTMVLPQIGQNTFIFYDPPYIEKGKDLYLNDYDIDDHRQLAECIVQLQQPWVVTYDYEAATRHDLYRLHRRLVYHLPYSAQARYGGKEVMFLSHQLKVPESWQSATQIAMVPENRKHPLYGKMEAMKPGPKMEELYGMSSESSASRVTSVKS